MSEPQRLADAAKSEWELSFETVGDPHQEIAEQCKERGWLELFVNKDASFITNTDDRLSHPKGYFQPGVLGIDSNKRILYRWRSIPTRANIGGAVERPTASYVYQKVAESLEQADNIEDAQLDGKPELDSKGRPFPIFVTLLLANGWFIRPVPFLLTNSKLSPLQRIKRAARRIPIFLAVWIAAFLILPTNWVTNAAIAYGVWVSVIVVTVFRGLQHTSEPENTERKGSE
ncbi:MAG: hypothetical protein HOF74_00950 [Gammaproteobacteria bacterium]|nr:hypothetical protein [Gammaproteobacteria bacterium]MBT3858373.1 hypothetical protein [Gammaproteobacteria bacterium]MBT3986283.1 hypothetical protein [Gammaproteobacteria bacterium]MBT4254737.1 hypothetical protein [Gammaproteobacteria bacterium]MBT4581047.1 hypothetical protein [Gammaproteobacteria bacterium]